MTVDIRKIYYLFNSDECQWNNTIIGAAENTARYVPNKKHGMFLNRQSTGKTQRQIIA
jgi:hypothetical protein